MKRLLLSVLLLAALNGRVGFACDEYADQTKCPGGINEPPPPPPPGACEYADPSKCPGGVNEPPPPPPPSDCQYADPSKCQTPPPPPPNGGETAAGWVVSAGNLTATIEGNENRPPDAKPGYPYNLNGVTSLVNTQDAPGINAFLSGLNLEHMISGCADDRNLFTPWNGPYPSVRLDPQTVQITRRPQDDPWNVGVTATYHMAGGNAIDIDWRFRPQDASQFCHYDSLTIMFPNYMAPVLETWAPIHFRGIAGPGQPETWISADATDETLQGWNQGGTWIHATASPVPGDANNSNGSALASYNYPRYTQPFYYGLGRNQMVFIVMFDRTVTPTDQIRFTQFHYNLKEDPDNPKPAWDWQFHIPHVVSGHEYGFKMRVLWKRWVDAADIQHEYDVWHASLP